MWYYYILNCNTILPDNYVDWGIWEYHIIKYDKDDKTFIGMQIDLYVSYYFSIVNKGNEQDNTLLIFVCWQNGRYL